MFCSIVVVVYLELEGDVRKREPTRTRNGLRVEQFIA